MRRDYVKGRSMISILVLVAIMGIGYATLGANLKINGTAEIPASSWLIRFKTSTIHVTNGSVSINTANNEQAAQIDDATNISYKVRLAIPGDFYEFTVDVENAGSIDAMIDSVSSKLGSTEITAGTLPNYLTYSVTYSDGTPIAAKQLLAGNGGTETLKVRIEFKKDVTVSQLPTEATTLDLNFHVNYVQKDSTAVAVPHPSDFSTDSWDTIISAAQNGNTSTYTVGSTKTVDMGSLGTHTLRVANNSTPAECSTTGFSQTACGFVLEFADIITTHQMNPYTNGSTNGNGNKGGWEYSEMRTYVNNDIYNALPDSLKNAIINTTVVSGHGSNDTTNFTTEDKLYLLSTKEVWGKEGTSHVITDDTAEAETRQLDYYKSKNVTTSSYAGAIKKKGTSNSWWWLRSAISFSVDGFFPVGSFGDLSADVSSSTYGVSPAFRIA